MLTRHAIIKFVVIFTMTIAPQALQAAPGDAAEVVTLRGEAAKIQIEMDALKERISALERMLANAGAGAAAPDKTGDKTAKPRAIDSLGSKEKPYPSLRTLLETVPKDLLPDAKNGRESPRLVEWLNENLKGKYLTVTQQLEVTVVGKRKVSHGAFELTPEEMTFQNMHIQCNYFQPGARGNSGNQVSFPVPSMRSPGTVSPVGVTMCGRIEEVKAALATQTSTNGPAIAPAWGWEIRFDEADIIEMKPPLNR